MSGEKALERLIQGNLRYVQGALKHPNCSLKRRQAVASKQEPFAIVVSCADSRVSPEIIFDQGIGDLFVVRVAGNVIGPLELDSIEFAAVYLHSSVIIVLGHEGCAAVTAVVEGNTNNIKSIASLIAPSVEKVKKENPENLLQESIRMNAVTMKEYLQKVPAIKKLAKEGKIEVHAAQYHLHTGAVEIL